MSKNSRQRINRFLWLLVPAALALNPASVSATALLKKGEPFSHARAKLLRDGWKPLETNLKMADGTPERTFGDARDIFKAGYREIEMCTGTGLNYCFFFYTKHGGCLRLITQGEYLADYHAEPRVDSWSHQCPPAGE